jgi:Superinfection immunity protein/Protein of unknown function (DUF2510)
MHSDSHGSGSQQPAFAPPLPAAPVYSPQTLPLAQAVPMMIAQAQSPERYNSGGPTIVTDRRAVSGVVLAIAWVLAVLSLGYMLPWAIAASRGKSNHGAIGLVNFFLGWSVLGWIAAMVMACQAHQVAGFSGQVALAAPPSLSLKAVVQAPATLSAAPGWYPAPQGTGQQYWDGIAWTTHRAP